MNILIFGNGTLSVAQQEHKIAVEIAKQGNKVCLICDKGNALFDLGTVENHNDLLIINCPANQYNYNVLVELKSKMPNWPPDVCLGMDQSVSPFVLDFKKHNPAIKSYCMFLDYPVHVVDDKASQSYNFDYAQRYYYWLYSAIELDGIIFNNQVAVDEYKRRFKRDSHLVWYSISEDNYQSKVTNDNGYVVACNRLIDYKGTDLLVDALSRTEYDYKHIAVSGNLREAFTARCAKLFGKRFQLIDRCGEREKMEVIANARLLVYPQITDWVGGLSPIEAMSVKTPAICFDYPVLRELYGDAVLYARKRSVIDLREKIVALYEDEALRNELAAKGYERYQQYFTKAVMAKNLVDVLSS